jgi:hypothetical protein
VGWQEYVHRRRWNSEFESNNNFLAAFLAISIPFFLRKKWWIAAAPIFYVIYISHTSAALFPAVLGLGFFLFGW